MESLTYPKYVFLCLLLVALVTLPGCAAVAGIFKAGVWVGVVIAVLVVGGLLYLVLVFPDDTRRVLPREMDYTWFQLGLLAVLLVLIVNLVRNMRRMGGPGDL